MKILSVEIVEGSTINPRWSNEMQLIKTDCGEYIDNLPNNQYGHFTNPNASPGFVWSTLKGTILDENKIKIVSLGGQKWLQWHGD